MKESNEVPSQSSQEAVPPVDDDWGDDRRSLDEIEREDTLSTLYDDSAQQSVEDIGAQQQDGPDPQPVQDFPQAEASAAESAGSNRKYSAEEWATLATASSEIQQLRADEVRLAMAKRAIEAAGGDIVKACGGDRDRAAAVRVDLSELEKSVKTRKTGEERFTEHLALHEEQHRLTAGLTEMVRQQPALEDVENRRALSGWLLDQGFSTEDVSSISPAQAAAAWKIFEQTKALKPKPTIPRRARRITKKAANAAANEQPQLRSPGNQFADDFYGSQQTNRSSAPQKTNDVLEILYGGAA